MASIRMWAGAIVALTPAIAFAQDAADLMKQIINDPGAPEVNGASAKLVDDAKVQGGKALRVQVAQKGAHPWDSTVGGAIKKPIASGDRLMLVFSARLEKGENGATTATLPYNAVQLTAAPYSTVISGSADIGPEWKDFQITGTSAADYKASDLKVTVQLATARQTVDFGPIVVLDRGK